MQAYTLIRTKEGTLQEKNFFLFDSNGKNGFDVQAEDINKENAEFEKTDNFTYIHRIGIKSKTKLPYNLTNVTNFCPKKLSICNLNESGQLSGILVRFSISVDKENPERINEQLSQIIPYFETVSICEGAMNNSEIYVSGITKVPLRAFKKILSEIT